ncbi:polysaccharide_lyase 8 family protein [Hexamita inflata]|uniref:Polysaccharide_lyase 8 family protein n=1 Tax=Hexamita inflata TaxID=28002 RepID=A0ABP1KUT6_9EUKA
MIYLCLIIMDANTDDIKKIIQNKKDLLTQNKLNSLVCPDFITNNANAASYLLSIMITKTDRSYLWESWKRIDQGPQLQSTLESLYQIALAYAIEPFNNYTNPHYKNAQTLSAITNALDLILTRYYTSSLKYLHLYLVQLKIGGSGKLVFLRLNNIIILIKDALFNQYILASRRFLPNPSQIGKLLGSTMPIQMPSTGGNLVDTARICFIRGLLSLTISESDQAFNALQHVLDFVTVLDGFYKDYSFIQHQSLASSASYGAVLFSGLTNLIIIINGSTLYNYISGTVNEEMEWDELNSFIMATIIYFLFLCNIILIATLLYYVIFTNFYTYIFMNQSNWHHLKILYQLQSEYQLQPSDSSYILISIFFKVDKNYNSSNASIMGSQLQTIIYFNIQDKAKH